MNAKINCWEFKKCGREPGGNGVEQFGICPVTTRIDFDMAHGGKNAGRVCWIVAGTLGNGQVQGTYAKRLDSCWRCDFMNRVKREEEHMPFGFSHTRLGIDKILEKQQAASIAPGTEIPSWAASR